MTRAPSCGSFCPSYSKHVSRDNRTNTRRITHDGDRQLPQVTHKGHRVPYWSQAVVNKPSGSLERLSGWRRPTFISWVTHTVPKTQIKGRRHHGIDLWYEAYAVLNVQHDTHQDISWRHDTNKPVSLQQGC